MTGSIRVFTLIGAGVLCGAGCSSQPVAMSAEVGSTIVIPIAARPGDEMGYGGLWYESNNLFDEQRGRLTFTFNQVVGGSDTATVDPLMVTRLMPDPSTKAAKRDWLMLGVEVPLTGQVIALVNVPAVDPGTYDIVIGRKLRDEFDVWQPVTPAPPYDGQIEVLASTGAGNLAEDTGGFDLEPTMDEFYPRPMFEIPLDGGTLVYPAAGHLVVNFPTSKASLKDVMASQNVGEDSIVSHVLNGSTLEIDFVSPETTLTFVGVAFKPTDPFGAGLPQAADFVVDYNASRLYDENGAQIHDSQNPGGINPDLYAEAEIR